MLCSFWTEVIVSSSFFPQNLRHIDEHGLKILGEGLWGFCQILGGRVYRGCENFEGWVHLFGVLLHFY